MDQVESESGTGIRSRRIRARIRHVRISAGWILRGGQIAFRWKGTSGVYGNSETRRLHKHERAPLERMSILKSARDKAFPLGRGSHSGGDEKVRLGQTRVGSPGRLPGVDEQRPPAAFEVRGIAGRQDGGVCGQGKWPLKRQTPAQEPGSVCSFRR